MAESAAINKSLSVLGQVVHALNMGAVSSATFSSLLEIIISCSVAYSIPQFKVNTNSARRFGW